MNKSNKPFTGLHVLGEATTKEVGGLKSLDQARRHIRNVIKRHNLHELGSFYYKFRMVADLLALSVWLNPIFQFTPGQN
jgi:hypothetical protein